MEIDSTWGPYRNGPETRYFLSRFVDAVCGPQIGIVWAVDGKIMPLRAPQHDATGFGDVLVFEWNRIAPAYHTTAGLWDKVTQFIDNALQAEAQAQLDQAAADQQIGEAAVRFASRLTSSHRDDGIGVLLDITGIALSLALIPTGLGALGFVALIGGAFLLGTDSYAYAMELSGKDIDAEDFKKKTEHFRIVATVMTLPDAIYGGYNAVRELNEIRELRELDATTAEAAEAMSKRSNNTSRAASFQQVAQRANLRAEIRTQQIRASLAHEIVPRGTGLGSAVLLIREEIESRESFLHEICRSLQIHCVSVHR